jgi:hypothetical protein
LATPLGRWPVTTQGYCWTVWQKPVMDRWKPAMFAARRGPDAKLSGTNSHTPITNSYP